MSFTVTQTKSILTSKTFYGALLALTSVVFPHFYAHLMLAIGITDPADIATKIVGGAGTAFALYGRFTATQHVTLAGQPILTQTPPSFSPSVQNGGLAATTTEKLAMVKTVTTITPVDTPPKG